MFGKIMFVIFYVIPVILWFVLMVVGYFYYKRLKKQDYVFTGEKKSLVEKLACYLRFLLVAFLPLVNLISYVTFFQLETFLDGLKKRFLQDFSLKENA